MSSSGNQSPSSPEQQFVTKLVNFIIRLTPVGGSGWVMVHFLLRQEWLLAIVTFPIMIATGAWAAYTSNFITASSESAGALGQQHARSLSQWLGQVHQKLQWRFAHTEAKYLQCQAASCKEHKTEGISVPQAGGVALLEEVYVPLKLRSSFARRQFPDLDLPEPDCNPLEQSKDEEPTYDIWKLLAEAKTVPAYRRIVITAKGGFGKTTLMRHVAYRYGVNPGRICRERRVPRLVPILLYLRDWRGEIAKPDAPNLPTLITNFHLPSLPGGKRLTLPATWADDLLRSGRALVMLDGFDEVAEDQKQGVSQWIDQVLLEYASTAWFILTSRPAGYEKYTGEQPWTPLSIEEFDEDQRNEFLKNWYHCYAKFYRLGKDAIEVQHEAEKAAEGLIEQIEQRSELEQMADNPLMLCMIATFHHFQPSQRLPQRRTLLYQRFCKLLLEDRPGAKGQEMSLPHEESQTILQGIAFEMVKRDCNSLDISEFEQLTQQFLIAKIDAPPGARQFVREIEEIAELLVKRESTETYEFSHRSFQEYLAAKEIKDRQRPTLLLDLGEEWREVALLYAAQTDPTELIQHLCNQQTPVSLALAYDCWRERRDRLPQDGKVFKQLQELCYQQLEQYMQLEQWQQADQYTYRLMIQVLGKSFGSGFSPKELLNFPCVDLRRIDDLWLQYSKSKFGFSVQKEIYLSEKCGGVADGKYDQEAWRKFAVEVGWIVDGNWVQYNKLIFSPTESAGHLPLASSFGGYFGGGAGCGWVVAVLFSRIETCNL